MFERKLNKQKSLSMQQSLQLISMALEYNRNTCIVDTSKIPTTASFVTLSRKPGLWRDKITGSDKTPHALGCIGSEQPGLFCHI